MKEARAESRHGRSYLVWPLREVGPQADTRAVGGAGQRPVAAPEARCRLGSMGGLGMQHPHWCQQQIEGHSEHSSQEPRSH